MKQLKVRQSVRHFKEQISLIDIIGILVGSLIMVIGIQGILIPAKILTGGITGVAIILEFISDIPTWIWFTLFNIPIFIAGYRYVSKRFVIYSLIATVAQAFGLAVMTSLDMHITDPLLASIFGGVVTGIGAGIIFRFRGSSGGLDIIAVIVKRFWGYNIGQTFFLANILVLALSLVAFNLELALFSAISIFVSSRTLDLVEAGPYVTKTAMIISECADDIAYEIVNNLQRGCTYLPGRGAYSGQERTIIMVTVGKTQLPRLKEIVFQLDPNAFITINETIEAYGKGFKSSSMDF